MLSITQNITPTYNYKKSNCLAKNSIDTNSVEYDIKSATSIQIRNNSLAGIAFKRNINSDEQITPKQVIEKYGDRIPFGITITKDNSIFMDRALGAKNKNGSYRFDDSDIKRFMYYVTDKNQRFMANVIGYKNNDGSNRFRSHHITELAKVYTPSNEEYINDLLNLKNHDDTYRFDQETISQLCYQRYYSSNPIKDFFDTKNPDGVIRIDNNEDVNAILNTLNTNPNHWTDTINNAKNNGIDNFTICITESKDNRFGIKYSKNNNTHRVIFDKEGSIAKDIIENKITNSIRYEKFLNKNNTITYTQRYKQAESYGFLENVPTHSIKTVKNKNNNSFYKEYYIPSKDCPNKSEIWQKDSKGGKYKIGIAEKTPAGDKYIEKTLYSLNGCKTDYLYIESPNGSRISNIQITDKNGKVMLNNKQQFKVIDDNHFQSIENGVKYDIEYKENKVVATKDNGEQVSIPIGKNRYCDVGILSEDLLPLLKDLSGSVYFDINKYGLAKISRDDMNLDTSYSKITKSISIAERYSKKENLFTLLHELGHHKDYSKNIHNNKELLEIYDKERTEFVNNQSDIEFKDMSYFLTLDHLCQQGAITEFIAETNALLYGNNNRPTLEQRGALLQQHFPQTFAKAAELLLKE